MDIAIVDDEKVIREQIKKLILEYTPGCNLETFAAGEDLLVAESRQSILSNRVEKEAVLAAYQENFPASDTDIL